MTVPQLPENEEERLKVLAELFVLDTAPNAELDRIVHLASAEFNVPIVLVSLVDQNRQWFKAKVGLNVCETARKISFCGHAILTPDLMIVIDATADPRFVDNPLVTGAPNIRFYAGAPLVTECDCVLGTLCLIDTKARELDDNERGLLLQMRDQVMSEIQSASEARAEPIRPRKVCAAQGDR